MGRLNAEPLLEDHVYPLYLALSLFFSPSHLRQCYSLHSALFFSKCVSSIFFPYNINKVHIQ